MPINFVRLESRPVIKKEQEKPKAEAKNEISFEI
jgi:hypothetical protein